MKAEDLGLAKAGVERVDEQGFERVTFSRAQESRGLLSGERVASRRPALHGVDCRDRVVGKHSILDGSLEWRSHEARRSCSRQGSARCGRQARASWFICR